MQVPARTASHHRATLSTSKWPCTPCRQGPISVQIRQTTTHDKRRRKGEKEKKKRKKKGKKGRTAALKAVLMFVKQSSSMEASPLELSLAATAL